MSEHDNVDVVIIGSGLGGILCGALLGQKGYRVIILERRAFPGGRYTSINKNGYWINTGAYAVGLHGIDGPLFKLLRSLGADIEMRVTPPHHIWVRDQDIALPEKGQLRAVIETFSKNAKESERILSKIRHALAWQEPSDQITCDQWLTQYTDNPLIHGFFDFFSRSMTGTYFNDFPAGEYFRQMRSFTRYGNQTAMPKNGQKTTMDNLMKILERSNVKVLMESKAEEIVCDNDQIKGVIASGAKGQIDFDTKVVISDIGPRDTVKLAGETNFEKSYLQEVSNVNETMAVVIVFGYDKPIINSPCHIQLIEWDRLTAAWEANHIWPGYAPQGKQNLIIYANMKNNNTKIEIARIMEQCKLQFPYLEKAEVIETLVFKGNWPILRAKPSKCLSIRTPIQGLYLAGDAVNPSGLTCGEGISFSSVAIAEDIKKRFPKSD
jgi:phytoene dehydrogenase-like protein